MAETVKSAIAVVGIDIGKNSFHAVGLDRSAPLRCDRGGRVAKLKRAWPICRPVSSGWRPAWGPSPQSQAPGGWTWCSPDAGEIRSEAIAEAGHERRPWR